MIKKILSTTKPNIFRHYKGNLYQVYGTGFHTETEEQLVLYKRLNDNDTHYFARPLDMFVGTVVHNGNVVKRFEKMY